MKNLAAIYERKGTLFVSASHRTKAGFWIDDEHTVSLVDPTNEELGQAVEQALACSKDGVTTPPPTARIEKPLLKAAGVASWATFMKHSRHVTVAKDDNGLKVTPYRNLGSKEGFEPEEDLALDSGTSRTKLGQIIADLIGRAT